MLFITISVRDNAFEGGTFDIKIISCHFMKRLIPLQPLLADFLVSFDLFAVPHSLEAIL